MKMKTYLSATLSSTLLLLFAFSTSVIADNGNLEKPEKEKREMLSLHETIAEFQGLEFERCWGKTGACPAECGASGERAIFKIVKYLKYEKPGKLGNPKQETYRIHVTDFHRKAIDDNLAPKIIKLNKGDKVMLSWRQDYVTNKAGQKFSDRVMTKFQIMENE